MISLLLRISPHSLQGTAIETHSHRPSLIVSCVAYDTQVAPALVGQTGAAACTTAGDNLAAVGSGHSLAEAVLLGALDAAYREYYIGFAAFCQPKIQKSVHISISRKTLWRVSKHATISCVLLPVFQGFCTVKNSVLYLEYVLRSRAFFGIM